MDVILPYSFPDSSVFKTMLLQSCGARFDKAIRGGREEFVFISVKVIYLISGAEAVILGFKYNKTCLLKGVYNLLLKCILFSIVARMN